ncbi:MAG: bifunctional glutamate N-acetyltransferase/amino-acid acetyltransferase ArgJ [Spirochaetia bacterium]|jgi:glutamate N-acetyltransferase/amino-acid N-acetyltransferase|nr:bifunctional glutamate N-acetyltransferase/amino-acid acetyltransferase ArgJ [Spirochaetia bacterium]
MFEILKKGQGGVTAAKGFSASGVACGLKKRKKDMAMIYSAVPCTFAGAFTTNLAAAAPVAWDRKLVAESTTCQAIVVNSGNANACTGEKGLSDAHDMAEITAEALGIAGKQVLVCSTGVIGVPMPMDTIRKGIGSCIEALGTDLSHGLDAATAILTTDTHDKQVGVTCKIGGKTVTIGGMAKGSGMIHPNMATMLSFITTDACISKSALQKLLGPTIAQSYNMISVDGDTSTNDTVLVLANGQSGATELEEGCEGWEDFKDAFTYVHTYLAKEIVRDGEGAGTFIEVTVRGARTLKDARTLARSVVSSNLVKAAFFGSDANWGRVVCAMGYSGVDFGIGHLKLSFVSGKGEVLVVDKGLPIPFDEDFAKQILLEKEVKVVAELKDGDATATAWGCDLTYDYVRINGDYRS